MVDPTNGIRPPFPRDQEGTFIAGRIDIFNVANAVARRYDWPEGLYADDVVSLARFLAGDTQ
jgi:hypothetical protein